MKVEAFIPCFVDQLYPETARNMIKLLEGWGCELQYNPDQTCCGQPAFNSGFWDEAKVVAQKFLNDYSGDNFIVSPSGSCTGMVKSYYGELFTNSASHNRCKSIQSQVVEFSDFVANILKPKIDATFNAKVCYHDACGALRECGIKEEPRNLLRQVKGLELVEMADVETCCGFGGTFAVKFSGISIAMAEQKVQNAIATGAEYMVSTDWSCLMHMQGYIDQQKLPLKTIHLIDILATHE